MSSALDFLDALGRGEIETKNADAFEAAVKSLDVSADQKKALFAKDANALRDALGGRASMMIQIWAPRPDLV